MRIYLFLIILIFLQNCSKHKSVLICGDHICVNNAEAKQFFEENLSIEVKIIDRKQRAEINLIELNLNNKLENNREISIKKKDVTKKEVKTLTNKEINKIKKEIKNKKKQKKIVKKIENTNIRIKEKKIKTESQKIDERTNIPLKTKNNIKKNDIVDVCSIIAKCNIEEISKYLTEQGRKKKFPDITARE